MTAPLLDVRELALRVPGRTLCENLSFTVHAGECWILLGPNGAGKTTLLHTLAGLRRPAAGEVRLDGAPLHDHHPRERARRIGIVPQDTTDTFPDTVLEIALAGRHPHLARWRGESAADVQAARAALAAVAMDHASDRDAQTLSGGERRRVALAMLLAQDPAVMLADEPTHHLDVAHEVRTLDLLAAKAHAGHAVLMSLHALTLAARHATHAVLMDGTRAQAGPAGELLTAARLSALFGQPLVAVGEGRGTAFVPA
ncbi:MAG: ABC transporter ATP-binding protein [Burkholderiales bacterium]